MTRGGSGVPARVGEGGPPWGGGRGVHATDWSGQRLIGLGLYSLVLRPGDRLCRQPNTRPGEAASDGKAQSCVETPGRPVQQRRADSAEEPVGSGGIVRPHRPNIREAAAEPGHASHSRGAAGE